MLQVNVAASHGAGANNEDVAGHCGNAAWVIDGATGVGDPVLAGVSDAAWFAHWVSAKLAEILHARPDIATRDLLIEKSEPGSLLAYPRIKAHDDVSFIQCECRAEK